MGLHQSSVYAGTIAPDVMMSRADGSGFVWVIAADGSGLTANFARYTDADPLCCPSRTSIVQYAVVDLGAGPVLTPLSVVTEDNVVG